MQTYRVIIIFSALWFLTSCKPTVSNSYELFIEQDFYKSASFRNTGEIKVVSIEAKERLSVDSLSKYDTNGIDLKKYDIINFMISYQMDTALERYQVLRLCDLNMCKHKFVLIYGLYA